MIENFSEIGMGNGHRTGNGPEINVLPGHARANLRAKWAARAKRLFTFFRAKQCPFPLFWAIARGCPFS